MSDTIDRLGRSITIVTAIIAATVSATSLLGNCSKQESERYAAFRAAVTVEDNHWKALYDDYLSTFGGDFVTNPERKRAKIVALFTIAQRKLPSFTEFAVDKEEKEEAIVRLTAMQTGLLNSLEQQGAGDPELARQLGARSYAGKLRIESPGAATQSSASVAEKPSEPVRREIVELTRESPTGWDVDLFWCDGSKGEANYRLAMAVGDSLAAPAKIGRSISPGVTLGRIRVRPAPPSLQRGEGPARATWVVADRSEGELSAATAIQVAINNGLGRPLFGLGNSNGTSTRWYISAFVCPGTGAATPTPTRNPFVPPVANAS